MSVLDGTDHATCLWQAHGVVPSAELAESGQVLWHLRRRCRVSLVPAPTSVECGRQHLAPGLQRQRDSVPDVLLLDPVTAVCHLQR